MEGGLRPGSAVAGRGWPECRDDPTLADIYRARARIAGFARRTPIVRSQSLSERTGAAVYLKPETLQPTGSFKVRGAASAILALPKDKLAKGVVTVSTGNHGRAVAHVAHEAGARAVVCLSGMVSEERRNAIRAAGGEVRIHGRSQDEASELAFKLARDEGLTMVNPFDDFHVIAGQGTAGLELIEDLPGLDTALVPVSGGALLGGIALALKSARPAIRVVGVSMERGASMHASLAAGRPVQVEEVESLADCLQGGIFPDNKFTFRMAKALVDDLVLVSEDEIAAAMAHALWRERLVVEGSGAVGIAAILSGKAGPLGQNVAIVLSGGNVEMARLIDIARAGRPA